MTEPKPTRPGDRTPTTYSEIQRVRDAADQRDKPSSEIPRLPAASPWSNPDSWGGQEPPLGLDVSAVEPVGSAHEIQESLDAARTDDAPASAEAAASAFSAPEK
jgi:hypothetical protein